MRVLIQSLVKHQLLQNSNWATDHLRQLFCICYGEITQMDQEYYHLFHYSLVYTKDLHVKLCQMPYINPRRHRELLMMD